MKERVNGWSVRCVRDDVDRHCSTTPPEFDRIHLRIPSATGSSYCPGNYYVVQYGAAHQGVLSFKVTVMFLPLSVTDIEFVLPLQEFHTHGQRRQQTPRAVSVLYYVTGSSHVSPTTSPIHFVAPPFALSGFHAPPMAPLPHYE